MATKENKFQAQLIKDIKTRFPGCLVLKNDSSYIQGVPDLTVLYNQHWAMLECKRDQSAPHQPNQEYYVQMADSMSFARFIHPGNREEVLDELQRSFQT